MLAAMRCCSAGGGNDAQVRVSRAIDKELKMEARESQECKMLLLGAGESGKSTFAKQMKILHMSDYSDEERAGFKLVIHKNIRDGMVSIINACEKMQIEIDAKSKELVQHINEGEDSNMIINKELAEYIKTVWRDQGVQKAVSKAYGFQYFDSLGYFMENIDRITAPEYTPTNKDILHSRSQTSGIVETKFKVSNLRFRMCDVAGQRSERRKWMHCFGDVRAVIVIVGISEYDQVLAEQEGVNRLHEALKLFGDICNSRWFDKSTMILFLNKMDLFQDKIRRVPLRVCFPEYTGANTFEACTQYIANKFVGMNKNPEKYIYTHLTCATDTDCIRYIFSSVMDSIIKDRVQLAE